jgi:hypothetical protein
MVQALRIFLALSSLWYSTLALDIQGTIKWNDVCTKYEDLGASKVILDDGRLSGSITKDGSFVIPDVQPGTYLLSVESHDYLFDSLRIDIKPSEPTPEIRPHVLGTPFNPASPVSLSYPISLVPRSKNAYFIPRESFNLVGMFQNPMMMIMAFTAVMMFAMPYIMKNMDPEMLEEMKGHQAKMANIQGSMQSGDIKSGISALLAGEEPPKTSGARSQSTPQNRNRGTKNKKR